MKVLLCHNYYQQPGGEDQSFADEACLLEANGHEVVRYTVHNDAIEAMGRLEVAARTLWNRRTSSELRALLARERPEVMHLTNTFPLISPSAYYAARRANVPVVQALRNYRLFCTNGCFLRDDRVCEDCLGRVVPWPGIVHGCYRNDRRASTVVAAMLGAHRVLGTWSRAVDLYYALTEFARRKFIEGGLPPEKVVVKPNFIAPDPGPGSGRGGFVVFVGRLAPEKGVDTLLAAWKQMPDHVPLRIVGDGPLGPRVEAAAAADSRITWLGRRSPDDVRAIVGEAACLAVPSLWYEGFPRTIVEAFAKGTPVAAARLGSLEELVDDGGTGAHFTAGDPDDLAAKLRALLDDGRGLARMRTRARQTFEARYTADANYRHLMTMYDRALARTPRPADRNE